MSCGSCGENKKIVARGLCRACYGRWYVKGTTDYAPKPVKKACSVGGCKSLVVAKGMCDKHYRRVKLHGDPSIGHSPDRGKRSKHPLYGTWKHFRRFKGRYAVCDEWVDDFWTFVFDVGERPGDKYRLYTADENKPLGPDNYVWKRSLVEKVDGEDDLTYQARANKVYRKARSEEFAGYDLKRHYGLTKEEYEALLETQDHKCGICGAEETLEINGKTVRLSVDHCHETGAIRGLLCSKCNQGLGCFKDSEDLLKKAIQYLKR